MSIARLSDQVLTPAKLAAAEVAGRDFQSALKGHGLPLLSRVPITTVQINLGKRCNQACLHCHVEAGPKRQEVMPKQVVERIFDLLATSPGVDTVDITGGAPELHPDFRWIVERSRALGKEVIDRCNLTILFEPGMEDLATFLASQKVRITASLPCYTASNVDAQRGGGVFSKSIRALKILNGLGYGMDSSGLELDLMYNPGGAFLPPSQEELEEQYHTELWEKFGVRFNRLLTLTNLPIKRFADSLAKSGELVSYLDMLENSFNPDTVEGLMCRNTISVGWTGHLYDCDFNQMLDVGIGASPTKAVTVFDVEDLNTFNKASIATEGHCFGCTAGSGSSCGGALAG
jgi:radical SAM/Cys-rich protein